MNKNSEDEANVWWQSLGVAESILQSDMMSESDFSYWPEFVPTLESIIIPDFSLEARNIFAQPSMFQLRPCLVPPITASLPESILMPPPAPMPKQKDIQSTHGKKRREAKGI